ncbi:hypothetical protein BDY24DRAFT_9319 [Mrakia frigida]|uniref:uncharacterized protein n=1 Tax=Mrakia frigida TaxID=29902 RepID=UPI003FCBF932
MVRSLRHPTSTTSKRPLIPPPPPFPRPTFRLSPPTHLFKPRPHPLVLLDPRSNWTPRRAAAAPPLSRPLNSARFETKPSQLDISIQDDNSADSNSQEGSAPIQAVTICTSGIWNRLTTNSPPSFLGFLSPLERPSTPSRPSFEQQEKPTSLGRIRT